MPKPLQSNTWDTNGLLPVAIFALLVALPFQWIALMPIGPLALKPSGLVLMVCTGLMFMTRRTRLAVMLYVSRFWPLILAYAFYLLFSIITLGWSSDPMTSVPAIVKNTMYFMYFVVVGSALSACNRMALTRAIRWGTWSGTALFLIVAITSFAMMGRNLLVDYASAIAHADINTLQYKFYPHLFNFHSGATRGDEGYVHHAMRNTLMGCFILYFILNQAIGKDTATSSRSARVIRTVTALFLIMIIITSVSRSNWIAFSLVIAGAGFALLPRVTRSALTPQRALFMLATLLTLAIMSIVYWDMAHGASQIVNERLGVMTKDSRLVLFAEAWRCIAANPLAGHGIGADLPIAGDRVHNLFIGAWYEGGITVLLLAVIYYATIAVYFLGFHRRMLAPRKTWKLSLAPQWVFVLPILPLFRAMLSGEGGNFTLLEWMCLSFFFGLTLAHERASIAPTCARSASYEPSFADSPTARLRRIHG